MLQEDTQVPRHDNGFSTIGEVHITMPKHLDNAVETFENAQANFSEGFIEVNRKRTSHS